MDKCITRIHQNPWFTARRSIDGFHGIHCMRLTVKDIPIYNWRQARARAQRCTCTHHPHPHSRAPTPYIFHISRPIWYSRSIVSVINILPHGAIVGRVVGWVSGLGCSALIRLDSMRTIKICKLPFTFFFAFNLNVRETFQEWLFLDNWRKCHFVVYVSLKCKHIIGGCICCVIGTGSRQITMQRHQNTLHTEWMSAHLNIYICIYMKWY